MSEEERINSEVSIRMTLERQNAQLDPTQNTEVLRRMTLKRQNAQSDPTQTEEKKTEVTQTASENNDESEEKYSYVKPPTSMLHRGPSRREAIHGEVTRIMSVERGEG